jgi:uncharacterized protein (TIGR02246 family)
MLRALMVLSVVLGLAVTPCLAKGADPKVVAEIKEVVEKRHKAFGEKDTETLLSLFAPNMIIMGTGPGDRWVGEEEIKKAHAKFFENFDSLNIHCTWMSIGTKGDVARLTAMCQVTSYLKNEKTEFPVNWSAVLEKQEGKWLFVTSHFSIPIIKLKDQ